MVNFKGILFYLLINLGISGIFEISENLDRGSTEVSGTHVKGKISRTFFGQGICLSKGILTSPAIRLKHPDFCNNRHGQNEML